MGHENDKQESRINALKIESDKKSRGGLLKQISEKAKFLKLTGTLELNSDPVAVLSFLAYMATTVYALVSVSGYAFLAAYYGFFGVRAADVIGETSHFFFRGIDLITLDPQFAFSLFAAISAFCFLGLLSIQRAAIGLSASLLAITASIGSVLIASTSALDFASRDSYAQTTALRSLICARISGETLRPDDTLPTGADRAVLILALTESRVILFAEPTIRVERPKVDVLVLKLGDGDAVRHSATGKSRSSTYGSFGGKPCIQ